MNMLFVIQVISHRLDHQYELLLGNDFGNIYADDRDYGYLFIASRVIEIW